MAYDKKIKTIQDIILNSFGDSNIKYKFIVSLINRDWADIIGHPLCTWTRPAYIYKNVLHIACSHNGIIQTLNFQADDILSRLKKNDYHYNITGIKFISDIYRNKYQ